jgi:hypothetical protein
MNDILENPCLLIAINPCFEDSVALGGHITLMILSIGYSSLDMFW